MTGGAAGPGAGRAAAAGAPIAFLDMDNTAVGANTGRLWVEDSYRRGEMGLLEAGRLLFAAARYRLGLMEPRAMVERAVAELRDEEEASLVARCEVFFREVVLRHVRPGAREAVARHRERGERVVLLTASLSYVGELLARHLELDDAVCTELEVAGGRFTGRVHGELCYGHGKLARARAYALRARVPLEACWLYTDSIHDLPVLEAVGHPVVVNPDPRLARHARRRGWPIRDFGEGARSPGSRPGAGSGPPG